ncbi:regulatory protein RecX [Escherichia coli]|uniref:regulatory protein RecX n=1 Tax=Gammaproteobacteria TaxID=1236 RepID=UPI0012FEB360|nr:MULTISPECIES: regulatory protein RecX [Gammaproteobacteria]MBV7002222.1 regulatory protein RecX [Escherichia coli]MBW0058143.1 regulatory protein RecX [Escherichia coli]MCV7817980.1 recombination regulator RecX [Escherichia coli]MCV7838764.1 recombination regulator RecX [Escherichia coli]MDK2552603.1 regulatory protein RecX [Escherichia coli]
MTAPVLATCQALQQEGLSPELIERIFDEAQIDWFEHAFDTHQRRFANHPITDNKDKARQLRFLQYRGFNAEECFSAIERHQAQYKE